MLRKMLQNLINIIIKMDIIISRFLRLHSSKIRNNIFEKFIKSQLIQ